jgi:hypothetical protein
VLEARLTAATAGLRTIVLIDKNRQGIVTELETWLAIKQKVIENLQTIDKNSQTIDTRQSESVTILRDQHREDKDTIGDLQGELEACQAGQKWAFGLGALTGGFVGYKIRGAGTFQNPFTPTNFSNLTTSPFLQFESGAEKNLREALKRLKQ